MPSVQRNSSFHGTPFKISTHHCEALNYSNNDNGSLVDHFSEGMNDLL
jgi:hypothetical protein